MERENRDDKIIECIEELFSSTAVDENNLYNWSERFREIYISDSEQTFHRHSYAKLSRFLYNYKDIGSEAITIAIENLEKIIYYVGSQQGENTSLKNALRKLSDHIELEGLHIAQFQALQYKTDGLDKTIQKYAEIESTIAKTNEDVLNAQKNAHSVQIKVNKLTKEMTSHNTQMVTILGIFAGVVFAFSGGFSMLGSVFSNLYQLKTIPQAALYYSVIILVGIILYDVVYALLRIVGHYANNDAQGVVKFTKYLNISALVLMILFFFGFLYAVKSEKINITEKKNVEGISTLQNEESIQDKIADDVLGEDEVISANATAVITQTECLDQTKNSDE